MIARVAIAIVLSAGTMAGPMRAQAPSAPERVGPALLPAERIASLPGAARDAWTAYIAASERLHARDTAAMGAERRAAAQDAFVRAPYAAADFTYFDRSETWLQSDSARMVADAVLTFQTRSGGWSKRTDMRHPRATAMSFYSETTDWHYTPTFDNGATTGQPIEIVRLSECQFHDVANGSIVEHVRGLTVDRVSVNGKPVDAASIAGGVR